MANKTIGALSTDLANVSHKFNQFGLQLFHTNDKIIYPIHDFATLAYRLAEYPLCNYIDKTSVSIIDKICDELDRHATMAHDLVFQIQHRLETVIDALGVTDGTDSEVISDVIKLLSSLDFTAKRVIITMQVARGHAQSLVLELDQFRDSFMSQTNRGELELDPMLNSEATRLMHETRDQLASADQASAELDVYYEELEELVPELERVAYTVIKALSNDE